MMRPNNTQKELIIWLILAMANWFILASIGHLFDDIGLVYPSVTTEKLEIIRESDGATVETEDIYSKSLIHWISAEVTMDLSVPADICTEDRTFHAHLWKLPMLSLLTPSRGV